MLVSVLASGSEGNSTFIQTKDKKILIDLGMNNKYITSKLEELGVKPEEIDYVLDVMPKIIDGLRSMSPMYEAFEDGKLESFTKKYMEGR